MKRSFLISIVVAAMSASMAAQRMAPAPHFVSRPLGFHPGFNHGRSFPALYPLGFFDPLYSNYFSDSTSPPAEPSVVVVQTPGPARPAESVFPAPSQPLMIELRGDSYVQVSGDTKSQVETIRPPVDAPTRIRKAHDPEPVPTAHEYQPALLIFRDGHREEISGYTIANGVLYAKADYYTVGSWDRAIQISLLNVPETVQLNASRGVPFHLPGSPNEVMVGP
jgi:hypothetical protein